MPAIILREQRSALINGVAQGSLFIAGQKIWTKPTQGGGYATLQYVGGTYNTVRDSSLSLTSLTGGIGTAPEPGDLVIVFIGQNTWTNSTPGVSTAGYTELFEGHQQDSLQPNCSVSYKIMSDPVDTSVSTVHGGSFGVGNIIHVWRGVDPNNPFDVPIVTGGGTNTGVIYTPSITPVTTGAVVLGMGVGASENPPASSVFIPSGFENGIIAVGGAAGGAASSVIASFAWTSGEVPQTDWGGSLASTNAYLAASMALRPKQL